MDAPGMEMKKRKLEENGILSVGGPAMPGGQQGDPTLVLSSSEPKLESNGAGVPAYLTLEDARVMVDLLSKEDLASIVLNATLRYRDVLDEVRRLTEGDPTHRKIFVRGLGWDTNTNTLRNTFSEFGELEEAIAIMDKNTGKSRGYGFVTYKHIDGALNALKEPSKRIDGRISVCQLASQGGSSSQPPQDIATRKIYVGNVPLDWPIDHMLSIFSEFGEIEEGPLGLDKQVGKARGYALFIYKSADSAKRALEEPVKNIGGHQLICKLASEGAKQRANMHGQQEISEVGMGQPGNAGPQSNIPLSYGGGQYSGAPQGMMSQGVPYGQNPNTALNTGLNTALGHGLNPGMHSNLGGSFQSQPVANNPSIPSPMNTSIPSSMNPTLGQAVNTGASQVGTSMGLSSYGSHGGMDPYGQHVSSYSGQQGGFSSAGAPTSMYSATQGPLTSQAPALQGQYGLQGPALQGQYGLPSYQSQQQLPSAYQVQPQVPLSYQGQQAAASSAPRMQQPPSMPYYGM